MIRRDKFGGIEMKILKKSQYISANTEKKTKCQVSEIIDEIRKSRDIGVRKYNLQFDKNTRESFREIGRAHV